MAFSPLGHGWLVDDFKFKSPDDFAQTDFRRTGMSHLSYTWRTMDSTLLSRTKFGKLTVSLAKKSLVPKFQGENFYKNKAIVDLIRKLATRKGCSVAQIALAWVAAQGLISIPGTTRASRLEENWASRNIELTADELDEMRQIVDAAKPVGERFNEFFQSMVGH